MDQRPVVSDLDFKSIKNDLVNYFSERPEFADYEFSGSSLNLLMDILAYNTHYNALTANFQLNESFIDTSLIRSNVVSLAKSLNYVPRSARSAETKITVRVPRTGTEGFYVIPAGSYFTASAGNTKYNFFTIQDYTVNFASGETTNTIEMEVYEGKIFNQRFVFNNTTEEFQSFDLQVTNIDTRTLTVNVNGLKYKQITPETEGSVAADRNTRVYFVEESLTGSHKIIFGNNAIGNKPEIGSVIFATFVKSSGELANGARSFAVNIPGRSDITIDGTPDPAQGGQGPETIQSIKDNAPHWFQSQFRAVTENDYKTFLINKFADIQSINVYGGEKVNEPGKVFIAIKPKSGDKLTNATKDTLLSEVLNKSSVVTIRPTFVDPEILKVVFKTVAIYDESNLTTNRNTLKAKIVSLIENLNNAYVGDFLSDFRESYFSREIEELDPSIESSNTRITLKITTTAEGGILDKYKLNFANKLYHPTDGFNSANGGVFTSSLFFREGQTNRSGFDDDGFGNIRLFDFIDDEKVTVEPNSGSIDYETGIVELQDFDPQDGVIDFTAIPDSFDVQATENIILQTDPDNSSVDVIEKNETSLIKNLNLSRSI
jgi:hypothetical protein|tara:strand:+ start:22755 stop:24560 length:1806 start_codon:yes stop_codon:yes gene_type:complete